MECDEVLLAFVFINHLKWSFAGEQAEQKKAFTSNFNVINTLSVSLSLWYLFKFYYVLFVCEQKTDRGVRVGVINNPSGKASEDNTLLYRAIWATLLTQKNKAAAEFVQKLLKEESSLLLQQGTKIKDLLIRVREGLKICIHSFISDIFYFVIV